MHKLFLLIAIGFLLSLSFAQTPDFAVNQQWNVYFEDGDTWTITLKNVNGANFRGTAVSPNFESSLEAAVGQLDPQGATLLGLSEDYIGFSLEHPSGNDAGFLTCVFPIGGYQKGQVFEIKEESTGPRVTKGLSCRVELRELSGDWPPAIKVAETWQLSLIKDDLELAAWTIKFRYERDQVLFGEATGIDERDVEAAFITEKPPQPNMLNTWVFALTGTSTPLYCIFNQEKPFSADTMTGAVMLTGTTCIASKLV